MPAYTPKLSCNEWAKISLRNWRLCQSPLKRFSIITQSVNVVDESKTTHTIQLYKLYRYRVFYQKICTPSFLSQLSIKKYQHTVIVLLKSDF